jgi:catechol 2,3-dioxygenase-like lactoylglutathione lyase family enzyme
MLGFAEVPAPEAVGDGYAWVEREGTQIHLVVTDDPVIPVRGHVAVVCPDFEATLEALRGDGFEPHEGRELWGERRAKVRTPAGHTVEITAAPPTARST